jgi:voltage-gated potassium channel
MIHAPLEEGHHLPRTRILALRRWLAAIFEDDEPRNPATLLFNVLLAVLIIANVATVALETVESIRLQFAPPFEAFERIATAIFAVEYAARVWASVDFRNAPYGEPLWGRLRYMRSFFALVDLVAVLPGVIGILGAADFRILRLLRLLRMLKLVRHSTTFGLLWSVLREEARSILALLFILLLTVTISGALMYLVEGEEQPAVFSSIPACMWWAIETLTTVGYGDMVPMTIVGRLLGGVVSIVGIGTLALFSGLITIGFLDQLKLYRDRHAPAKSAERGNPAPAAALAGGQGELIVRRHGAHDHASARFEDPATGGNPPPGVCPHCGSALSHSTTH